MAEGEFALVLGHLGQALRKGVVSPGTGAPANDHDLYAMLADAAASARDPDALQRYAPLAEQLADRHAHTLYRGLADRAFGVAHRLAGETDAAGERFGRAHDAFERLGTRWQLGHTLLERAEWFVDQGNRARAAEDLARAAELFESLGAKPYVARARGMMAGQ